MTELLARAFASLLLAFTLASPLAVAQTQSVFKCIDSQGRIAFQDVPCKSGLRELRIAIIASPASVPSPEYSTPDRRGPPRQPKPRASARQAIVYSFECRTESGALFFRHDHCPGSIDRSGLIGGRRSAAREKVSGTRIPRLDACRGMRSVGRDGREFDDAPSTYDRNLGRDPCRRY